MIRRSASFRLPRDYRLNERREFLRFFEGSELFRFRECIIYRVPNELDHFRLGITIKARPSSIERTAVKRLIREWMRKNANLLGAYDYNIVVPSRFEISYQYRIALSERLKTDFSAELKRRIGAIAIDK